MTTAQRVSAPAAAAVAAPSGTTKATDAPPGEEFALAHARLTAAAPA